MKTKWTEIHKLKKKEKKEEKEKEKENIDPKKRERDSSRLKIQRSFGCGREMATTARQRCPKNKRVSQQSLLIKTKNKIDFSIHNN